MTFKHAMQDADYQERAVFAGMFLVYGRAV